MQQPRNKREALETKCWEARKARNWLEAERLTLELIKLTAHREPLYLIQLGDFRLFRGDHPGARKAYEETLQRAGTRWYATQGMLRLMVEQGNQRGIQLWLDHFAAAPIDCGNAVAGHQASVWGLRTIYQAAHQSDAERALRQLATGKFTIPSRLLPNEDTTWLKNRMIREATYLLAGLLARSSHPKEAQQLFMKLAVRAKNGSEMDQIGPLAAFHLKKL